MLLIPCPYCGDRDEDEFVYGGECARNRPKEPSQLTDSEWADYLYNRSNTKGEVAEWWWHAHGCTKWFQIERDTVTHSIRDAGWKCE